MDKLVKGTIENVVVDVTDRLQGITDLAGKNGRFDVRKRSGITWLIQNQSVSSVDGMQAFCLIDTTGADWTPDVYELFLTIDNPPESPRIGPMEFEVAFAMPEG